MSTPIKAISWNVNGIRASHKKGLIAWMEQEQPDILCLQETKAWVDQLPDELINIPGYQSFFFSAERKGYSGVAIYTKLQPESVQCGFGIDEFDNEGRTLVIDFGSVVLLNVYFPNGKASEERLSYKMRFYTSFLDHILKLTSAGKHVIICGDVNTAHQEIDIARPKENSKISGFLAKEREWIDELIQSGFIDAFRMFNSEPNQYTWWDVVSRARERNVGWRIDYFFVSQGLRDSVSNAYILQEVMGSDHCPIGLEFSFPQ